MSDDKDELDPSDWLASQFDPTSEVPQQKPAPTPPATPAAPPFGGQPPTGAPPAFGGQPPASAPHPTGQGGFNWGLRPGGAEQQASAPVPPEAAPPVAPYLPPAAPPTTPYVPPTTPYIPPSAPPQPPAAYHPPPLVEPPAPAAPPPDFPTRAANPPMTEPMSWEDVRAASTPSAAPPAAPLASVDQPTEAYTVQPWDPFAGAVLPVAPTPSAPSFGAHPDDLPASEPTSALDALFGENQFQEYEELGVLQTMAPPPSGEPATGFTTLRGERAPFTHNQKVLMWVAGALVAALALVALFLLGQRIGAAQATPPPASQSTTAASSAPTAAPGTRAAAGVQPWTALGGGECIQPFTSAWAATFTVVDCGASHGAQLLFKGTLPDAAGTAYPNGAQFQSELQPLCTSPTVINYSVAKAVTDLQVSYSYPATSDDWDNGDRSYYCFVNRASGDPLPGDLSVTQK